MNKKILIIIPLIISGILSLFTAIWGSEDIFTNPFQYSIDIEYPSFATEKNGNLYIIDQSLRRIIKTDLNGNADFIISGGSRDEKSFYNATEAACDQNDNIYIINRELDSEGFFTVRESILMYNSRAEFLKTIFDKKYGDDSRISQLVQRGQLSGLQYMNGSVSWFEISNSGITLYEYETSKGKLSSKNIIKYTDANIFISSVTMVGNRTCFYTTRKGEIFSISGNKAQKIFPENDLPSVSVPWNIRYGGNTGICFADLSDGTIKSITMDGKIRTILSSDILRNSGYDPETDIFYSFYVNDEGVIISSDESAVIRMDIQNNSSKAFSKFKIPSGYIINRYLKQGVFLFLSLLFLTLLMFLYWKVMNRKLSLIIKQILIFVPITVFALLFTAKMIFDNMSSRYQKEITDRLSLMVQIIPQSINGDLFNNIKEPKDFMNPSFMEIRSGLHNALNDNMDSWNSGYYFALHHVIDGKIYSLMWLNDDITPVHPFSYLNDPEGVYVKALSGEIMTEKAIDAWGLWMDAVGPIYDSKGNLAALIEIGKDYTNYAMDNERLFLKLLMNVCIISLIFITIFTLVTFIMLTKIRSLRNGAKLIASGNWDIRIKPRSNDEVTELTNSFNEMADSISTYVKEIIELNKAYYRFVPEQFLKFLNKQSVKEITLGDQMQIEMTIMFTDIRNFTEMSEKMTPKENFDFLNHYLGLVGPVVRDNEGFIDKYIGDAIMALFPVRSDDAVQTAIDISRKVTQFNIERIKDNHDPISIGFGIHSGLLTLGILGETERVDSTVISDNVNLASRLEGLTKKFGASIIISELSYNLLEENALYSTRYLGKIQVKGKEEAVTIYEILDGLDEETKKIRLKTKEYLENAINFLINKELAEARKNLVIAYKFDKDDKAIQFYYKLCQSMEKYPDKYSAGSIIMTEK